MQRVPAGVAQSAEQPSCKRQVSGSNPLTGSTFPGCLQALSPADSCRRRGDVIAEPQFLDTEITSKARNRAEQVGMHGAFGHALRLKR